MSREMAENPTPGIALPFGWRPKLSGGAIACWALLGLLALFVIYPIYLLVHDSFSVSLPGGGEGFSVVNWVKVWDEPGLVRALINTLNRAAVTIGISLPISILLAWLVARTDIPGKGFLVACAWVAYFMPTLPVLLGWILLLDPQYGLLNKLLKGWFGLKISPFNIYSFWGIIFAHLMTKAIAIKFIFLIPAFKNISSSLEEASRVAGAGTFTTLRKIVVPVLLPAILITLVISLIQSLESFEIELVLGAPWNFHVFSTKIYQLIHDDPPALGQATVLGVTILAGMLPLIVLQRMISQRRNYVTFNSSFKSDPLRLRKWRWPVFTAVGLFSLSLTLLPLAFLMVGTFMKAFGYFELAEPYTTSHWKRVLNDSQFLGSVANTFELGLWASGIGTLLAAVIAYVSVRTKFRHRAVIDTLTWLPASIPGVILGLGLLSMFLRLPLFSPFYGTIGVLIIAVLFASLTTGTQLIKSNLIQLGVDLEEASTLAGGSWFYTFRRIVLPLVGGALVSVAVLIFASATRNVANIAMLVTNQNKPLAMLQIDYMADGIFEAASIVGVITVLITCGVAGAVFWLGKRLGLRV